MARQPKKIDYTDVPQSLLDEHPFYGFQLDENQAYFVNRIWDPDTKIIFCDARAGSGKAQPVDTVIPTPNGDRKLGDLSPGDFVFDRCGNPTRILGVFNQGLQRVFRVTLSDGRQTLCCDEHLWTYYRNNDGVAITETLSSMLKRSILCGKANRSSARYNIPTNEPLRYPEKDLPVDPYVVGAFLGDGCCTSKVLEYSSENSEIPETIANILCADFVKYSDANYTYQFKRDGKTLKFQDVFGDMQELHGYAYDKHIPHDYLYGSVEQRFALLQGLMDTDGSISYRGGRYATSFSTSSKTLVNDFVILCRSLGIITSVHEDRRSKYKFGISYSIQLLCDNDIKPKLFRLSRKLKLAEESLSIVKKRKHSQIAIRKVEDLGYECEMVCIYVDNPEHLYLTNDCIVTHNTQMAFAVANLLYLYGRYPGGIIYVVSPYGEAKQGFLPGDIVEKSEVYFEPLYQAIVKCDLQPEKVIYNESLMTMKDKQDQVGYVKCLTHTYLRGTNFEDAVVILDESQNYSFEDLKKTLTRISDSCKVIVIGHHKQKDTDDNTDAFMRYLEYYKQMEESGEKRVSVCDLVKNYRGWISQSADDLYLDNRKQKQSSEESVLYQKHLIDE